MVEPDMEHPPAPASENPDSGRGSPGPEAKLPVVESEKAEDSAMPVAQVEVAEPALPMDECAEATCKSFYDVKWTIFNETRCPIVTQEANGPCPLLSLMNLLLLRGKTALPDGCEVISSDELVEKLADILLASMPKEVASSERLNYEQNINDAIALLPSIVKGLFVNIRFGGVTQFEFTDSLVIFDLLNVPLYHAWVVDPQNRPLAEAVGNLGYNELTAKIVTDMSSEDDEKVSSALLSRQFLEESASQMTFHGLCELNEKIRDGELAVMFRNNHFSTLYKQKGELFELMNDQGFLKEPSVVWQTLATIDGDCQFVDHNFKSIPPKDPIACDGRSQEQQIDQDLLLAMTIADEEKKRLSETETAARAEMEQLPPPGSMSDEELAKKLQEEENASAEMYEQAADQEEQRQGGAGQQPQRPQSRPQEATQARSSQGFMKKAGLGPRRPLAMESSLRELDEDESESKDTLDPDLLCCEAIFEFTLRKLAIERRFCSSESRFKFRKNPSTCSAPLEWEEPKEEEAPKCPSVAICTF
eukprot:maker-scaffold248_size238799-snap-gene-1.35 protein:Tk02162 transcript:maker-scaffold248_size238799-snap-gene-1.35-mRNA-1 annotation:"protein fam63b"